jgi:thiol-disulfide isomerase/thioredoxin
MHLSCMPSLASTAAALRRRATPLNVVMLALWVFVAIRFFPHAKALVGIPEKYSEPPEYFVSTLDGRPITADSLRGKVVLVNFWATWCGTCVVEMPSMEKLVEKERGKPFRLLAVSVDDDWPAVRKFFAKGTPLDVLLDSARDVPKAWGTEKFPESFLIDKDGTIRYYIVSNRDWSAPAVSACIDAMLD